VPKVVTAPIVIVFCVELNPSILIRLDRSLVSAVTLLGANLERLPIPVLFVLGLVFSLEG